MYALPLANTVSQTSFDFINKLEIFPSFKKLSSCSSYTIARANYARMLKSLVPKLQKPLKQRPSPAPPMPPVDPEAEVNCDCDYGPRAPPLAPRGKRCIHCWTEHVVKSSETQGRIRYFRRPVDRKNDPFPPPGPDGRKGHRQPVLEGNIVSPEDITTSKDSVSIELDVPIGLTTENAREMTYYSAQMRAMERFYALSNGTELSDRFGGNMSSQDLFIAQHTYFTLMCYAAEEDDGLIKRLTGRKTPHTKVAKEVADAQDLAINANIWQLQERDNRRDVAVPVDAICFAKKLWGAPITDYSVPWCWSSEHHEQPTVKAKWFWVGSRAGGRLVKDAQLRLREKGKPLPTMDDLVKAIEKGGGVFQSGWFKPSVCLGEEGKAGEGKTQNAQPRGAQKVDNLPAFLRS